MKRFLVNTSLNHPKWVITISLLLTVGFGLLIPRIHIDTDPENMLPADEAVRVFHADVEEIFGLNDYLVVGIVREEGVFRPETLERVAILTEAARDLDGVIADDILAPGEVDDISTTEDGTLRVATLMEEVPETVADAERILVQIGRNPVLRGKLASDDGKAMALFLPLESKSVAHEVAAAMLTVIDDLDGDEEYHLAGVPLAQDTFGGEMFKQMAVSAPAAFLIIFLLMLYFFRNPVLVLAPMIVAMMSVIWTMGLLIGLGFTVHIMSSMIPIFLIPIAVLNSIHMLTEFHEKYAKHGDMRPTIVETMDELFVPMIFTSLTTVIGFASLTMTPIPPVQVFGAFVAFGIAIAWLLSVTFNIAYASLLSPRALAGFGAGQESGRVMRRSMHFVRDFSLRFRVPVLIIAAGIIVAAGIGLTKIEVNDNPVKWFKAGHPLRVADAVMNEHLAGTYLAFLSVQSDEDEGLKNPEVMRYVEALQASLEEHPNVGATTSIANIVKKVGEELRDDPAAGVIPDNREQIAQYLFLYEMSGGDPEDLFKLITPENDRANVWVQMNRGENRAVASVVQAAEDFVAQNPPPGLDIAWAGLPYINVVWQQKMVAGMGKALAGSFGVVLLMMIGLFRSVRLGVLSMVPLTMTILFVYGFIGFIGKPYDMPIAVLSALTLGLSIDFAIHFLQRTREAYRATGDFRQAMNHIFEAPSHAITRNILVIAIGFVPMFFASLVPYVTVSAFFFAIMLISGFTTLFTFPAVLSLLNPRFLAGRVKKGAESMSSKTSRGTAAGLILALAAGASLATADSAHATEDAEQLMKEAHLNLYYEGDDGRAVVDMVLTDKRGKERTRKFVMLRKDFTEGGEQKYYTYFLEPSDVRGTSFMVWKSPDADDSRWIYVPAVDLVKRISAKDKGSSFVGSDFSYEDVSGRHWSEDTHTLLREEELDGRAAWVVESVPREKDAFARKLTWISKEQKLPLREEYYDRKDKLERVFLAERIEEVDGHLTVSVRSMTNEKKGRKTVVTFGDVEYDRGIEEKIFTERYLKNPPSDLVSE